MNLDRLRKTAEAVENGESWYVAEDWGSKLIAEGPDDVNYIEAFSPDVVLDLLEIAQAAQRLLDETGVDDLCSGLSITEYGCAGCPAHDAAEALGRLGGDT